MGPTSLIGNSSSTSSLCLLLQALQCQLNADNEDTTSGDQEVLHNLVGVPTPVLLQRLLKVLQQELKGTGDAATNQTIHSFARLQGWQTLLALLSSTLATEGDCSDALTPALAAQVLELLVSQAGTWPAFAARRVTHLVTMPRCSATTLEGGWRLLAAAAEHAALFQQLNGSQLLQVLSDNSYQQQLPMSAVHNICLLLMRSIAQGHLLAPTHRLVQLLLQLHEALCDTSELPSGHHCPAAAAAAASPGHAAQQQQECGTCSALLQLLFVATETLRMQKAGKHAAAAAVPEADGGTSSSSSSSSTGSAENYQTAIAVIHLVKSLDRVSPKLLAPKLTGDGAVSSYTQQPAAAELCTPADSNSSSWGPVLQAACKGCSNMGDSCDVQAPGSHLEAALQLLLVCCQLLHGTQKKKLYQTSTLSELLQHLSSYSTPSVQLLTQQLYGCMCQGFFGLRQDVLDSGVMLGMLGMLRYSTAPGVKLAALEKLPRLLDCCSAGDFVLFCQSGQGLNWVVRLLSGDHQQLQLQEPTPATTAAQPTFQTTTNTASISSSSFSHNSSSSSEGAGMLLKGTVTTAAAPGASSLDANLLGSLLRAAAEVYCSALDWSCTMRPIGGASISTIQFKESPAAGVTSVTSVTSGTSDTRVVTLKVPRWGAWRDLTSHEVIALQQVARQLLSSTQPTAGLPRSTGSHVDTQPTPGTVDGHNGQTAGQQSNAAKQVAGQQAAARQAAVSYSRGRKGSKDARCLPALAASAEATYDDDGLRVVWDSGPSSAVRAVRSRWAAVPLRERIAWTQTLTDVEVRVKLPPGTTKADVSVNVQRKRLTIKLNWCGRVVDGPLYRPVQYSSSCWSLDTTPLPGTRCLNSETAGSTQASGRGQSSSSGTQEQDQKQQQQYLADACSELLLLLPKEDAGHYWKALFEGGEEKSYWEILTEAVQCEEDAREGPRLDELGPEAAVLWEDLQERAAMVANGELDLQHGFDDFRIVIGDNTL